jgi:hypothetical protein
MSRYLLLLLLNLPFILLAILGAITQYKLNHSNKKRLVTQVTIWTIVLIGLASAEFIYNWLFKNELTQTEALSLFDVIQITAIVIVFYIANRSRTKIELLEKRVQDLHQEISIMFASINK